MDTIRTNVTKRRLGFTLVEMLVVVTIVVALAAITAAFLPRVQERQRAAKGAELLQQWLLTAKQWALRDRVPTGLRIRQLASDDTNPSSLLISDLQYIQQPGDFSQGRVIELRRIPEVAGFRCTFVVSPSVPVDFKGGGARAGTADQSPVQAGDYLEVQGGGLVHQIAQLDSVQGGTLYLATQPTPFGSFPGGLPYRILRQPRPVAGEPLLQLPQGVVLDLNPGKSANVPTRRVSDVFSPTGQPTHWTDFSEIVFSPSGGVIGAASGNKPIILWVRDAAQDDNDPAKANPTLIAIYPRSGLIAAHPVAPGADPYQYARDGHSSGL
jgi:prepilin-type N-terminal cleavage/methylation domain-containing protein